MKKLFIALLLVPMLHAEPVTFLCIDIDNEKIKNVMIVDPIEKYIEWSTSLDVEFKLTDNWKESIAGISVDTESGAVSIEFHEYTGKTVIRVNGSDDENYVYQCKITKSLLHD